MKKDLKFVALMALGVFVGIVLFCGGFLFFADYMNRAEAQYDETTQKR